MKKGYITAILLFFVILCGCAKPAQDSNTLYVWHWMVDRHDAFEVLAQKYKEQTGITVQFQLFAPSDIYSQKIVAAAQARILPDIFGVLDTKSVFADFIKSGFVEDLTEEFAKDNGAWEKSLFARAVAANLFEEGNSYGVKPGIYGVPLDVMNIQILYNKKLLKKAGINSPPKTFDEFIEATQALKRVGISGLVSGWGEHWLIDCFASNYAFNIMGEDKIMATYRGEVPYTDPDWIKVFGIFQTLVESESFVVGIVTKTNKFAEQDFALERAAFAFNGSWCANVYNDMNPDLDYGVMMPPSVDSKYPLKIWGGAGSSFMVNEAAFNKEKAVQFLKWLSAKEQQAYLSEETKNLPANRYAASKISRVLSDFASAMDNTTHPTIWPLDEDASVKEKFDKGLQSIIIGEKTPQEVAAEVQKAKERQMEKKRRRQKK
jgi:ABC-type glycerol-3-phosphate transport system substrate-binding protein